MGATQYKSRRASTALVTFPVGERVGLDGLWVIASEERVRVESSSGKTSYYAVIVTCPVCRQTVTRNLPNLMRVKSCGCARILSSKTGRMAMPYGVKLWLKRKGNRELLSRARDAFASDPHYLERVMMEAHQLKRVRTDAEALQERLEAMTADERRDYDLRQMHAAVLAKEQAKLEEPQRFGMRRRS
jgi:hypothetical protein